MTQNAASEMGLFVNIGQRDLQLDGQPLNPAQLRERSRELAADFKNVKARIRAPMIEAAMKLIYAVHGVVALRPFVFFATDQPDADHRAGDTIECAKLLKRWLAEQPGRRTPDRIEIVSVSGQPNLYDIMFSEYGPRLSRYAAACTGDAYLLCAGGTPACNTALILAGTIAFGERAHVLTVNPGQATAAPLAFGRQILESYRRSNRRQLLERRDFDGVAACVANGEHICRLAAAASDRMNFDFAESFRKLKELRESLIPPSDQLNALCYEGSRLVDGNDIEALRDLYWNAKLKWDRGEYADFLGRVWRLREAALYREVGRLCGEPLDKDGKVLKRWIEDSAQAGLKAHLALQRLAIEMNNKVLQSCLVYVGANGRGLTREEAASVAAVNETTRFLEKASALRNKSIIAHGYEGLSRDRILDALGVPNDPEAMFERLRDLLAAVGVTVGEDPFARFAELIEDLDDRE